MFSSLSLSLSLLLNTLLLSVCLDRLLARSFAIGRPLERSKSAKTTSDPVSKKGPSTTQQGNVKTEANRWRIEDGGKKRRTAAQTKAAKRTTTTKALLLPGAKHTHTHGRTHLALIAAERRTALSMSATVTNPFFLSFLCFAVVAKPPFVW